ncbi:MAG: hypothetical protein GX977_05425 [Firmicutes bacterium]|nr:hypothetical protein [Bacillota bacterium]
MAGDEDVAAQRGMAAKGGQRLLARLGGKNPGMEQLDSDKLDAGRLDADELTSLALW